jgi:hypothetical protein
VNKAFNCEQPTFLVPLSLTNSYSRSARSERAPPSLLPTQINGSPPYASLLPSHSKSKTTQAVFPHPYTPRSTYHEPPPRQTRSRYQRTRPGKQLPQTLARSSRRRSVVGELGSWVDGAAALFARCGGESCRVWGGDVADEVADAVLGGDVVLGIVAVVRALDVVAAGAAGFVDC